MQCYTELTPPTAVTHSLNIPFLSAKANNLVVAKTSLLQIFSLKYVATNVEPSLNQDQQSSKNDELADRRINDDGGLESSFLGAESLLPAERIRSTKLVLVAEYPLSGTITSLVRVKSENSKSGGDYLLIGFKDAKLSLVEWDAERYGLATISIHLYEQDELQGSPWAPRLSDCVNYLTVDPGSRCAALKFGARNLAILPFRQGDEDLAMDDWDEDLDGPRPEKTALQLSNGDGKTDTPYGSSFVLRLSSLDPNLIFPIHLDFLHEYREPTFGILSSKVAPASSLLHERKDHLSYMVFTLDLEQRASTTILSVTGLPYDLYKIVPLPTPVGGALLVGGNELIHIDQAGKSNGVGVNMFAKQTTSFGLADQSDLEMRLEGCIIEQLTIENGEMLMILNTGELAIISFKMDGRSVSGVSVRRVSAEAGGHLIKSSVTSISTLGRNGFFVGSENWDSVVLGWTRNSSQISRKKSRQDNSLAEVEDGLLSDEDFDEDDADDDLYGDGPTTVQPSVVAARTDAANTKSGDYIFRINDTLLNIAPMRDITFGKGAYYEESEEEENSEGVSGNLQLIAATGYGKAGALVILEREINPKVIGRFDFPEAQGFWTVSAKKPATKGLQVPKSDTTMSGDDGVEAQLDRLMIVSKSAVPDSAEESAVYALTDAGFEALTGTEFEPAAGGTVEAGTLGNGLRIVQVLKSEVRSYDGDLGLAQILPMFDDETGAEPKIISASFADPYLLLVRDDASIFIVKCDESNELEEMERGDALLATKWLSGCLYTDSYGIFAGAPANEVPKDGENTFMFLMSAEGGLHIFALPDLSKPVYVAEGLSYIPPTLSADYIARRLAVRETLTEILVADLGDTTSKSPYLILRGTNDDLTIYEPFHQPSTISSPPLSSTLRFLKAHNPHLGKNPGVAAEEADEEIAEPRNNPLRVIPDIAGYSAVFLPGQSPSFILKSSRSMPKVLPLRGAGVRGLSSFHTAGCDRGFIYADTEGIARVSQIPFDTDFTQIGMPIKRVPLDSSVHALTYHPPSSTYVVGTSTYAPFELPKDDDHHRDWTREDIAFKPLVESTQLKLINPITWSVIDTIALDEHEVIMVIKTLNLEVSEVTNEKKLLVVVGTAVSQGEDLPIQGRIYVYEVISVVPEPDKPETNKKLKMLAKEEIPRGAITAISEIGTQGFMLVAQGQKCMVRGLKEDGTLLPVAFMDMNCYVTSIKELGGTGMCVMGDAVKGVWFAGYTEEPYRMLLFGKGATSMEVVATELLPDGEALYIVVADAEGDLHVLQYDPEHPKSLHGHLLLHRTTFAVGGHIPSTMTLLPRTTAPKLLPDTADAMDIAADATIPAHEILITSITGSISLLTPLSESQYRRLSTLSNHLTNTLYHACGLNPRAYRIDPHAPEAMVGGRAVVDGGIVGRFMELGSQKRAEVAGRVGVSVDEIREDLEDLRCGLAYL